MLYAVLAPASLILRSRPVLSAAGSFDDDGPGTRQFNRFVKWDAVNEDWINLSPDYWPYGSFQALECGPVPGSMWMGGWLSHLEDRNNVLPNIDVNGFAFWNGTHWGPVTDGSRGFSRDDGVLEIYADPVRGGLWLSGPISQCGSQTCDNLVYMTAADPMGDMLATGTVTVTFTPVSDGTGGQGTDGSVNMIRCEDAQCNMLLMCGDFTNTGSGSNPMAYIGRYSWTSAAWMQITDGTSAGFNSECFSFVFPTAGPYAGKTVFSGRFEQLENDAENLQLGGLMSWDPVTSTFAYVGRHTGSGGSPNNIEDAAVRSVVIDEDAGVAYVGGESLGWPGWGSYYDWMGGHLWVWDITTDAFTPITDSVRSTTGLNADVYDMALMADKLLIVGSGSDICDNAWIYDRAATTFACLTDSNGNSPSIYGDLRAVAAIGDIMYIAGSLTAIEIPATGFMLYPGSVVAYDMAAQEFQPLTDIGGGYGTGGKVNDLLVSAGVLYVVGGFGSAGQVPVNFLLAFDGTSYTAVPDAPRQHLLTYNGPYDYNDVTAMAFVGGKIHIGGKFSGRQGFLDAYNYAIVDPATGAWSTGYSDGSGNYGFERRILHIAPTASGGVFLGGDAWPGSGTGRLATAPLMQISSAGVLESTNGVGASPVSPIGSVRCSADFGGVKLFAGEFSSLTGSVTTSLAAWDGTSLTRPSFLTSSTASINNVIYSMAVYANQLVVGGTLTSAGGVAAQGIAFHSGVANAAWTTPTSGNPATGLTHTVRPVFVNAMLVDGTKLYVGGVFLKAGGVDAFNVAVWDGSAWRALVDARAPDVPGASVWERDTSGGVFALAKYNGYLYIGGKFDGAGPHVVKYVTDGLVKFDLATNQYSPVGVGLSQDSKYVKSFLVANNKLYIAGNFEYWGTVSTNNVAKYENGAWSAIDAAGADSRSIHQYTDNGVDNEAVTLALADLGDGRGPSVILGGKFATAAGNVSVSKLASANPVKGRWLPFPPDSAATGQIGVKGGGVYSIVQDPGSGVIVIAGDFTTSDGGGDVELNGLAGWTPCSGGLAPLTPATDDVVGLKRYRTFSWDIAGVFTTALLPALSGDDSSLVVGGSRFFGIGDTPSQDFGVLTSMRDLPYATSCPATPSPSPSAAASVSASPSPSVSAVPSATPSPSSSVGASPSSSVGASPSSGGGVVSASASASVAASASALPLSTLLVPYTLNSETLCSATGLIEAILDPEGNIGPVLRAQFALALGFSDSASFINAIIACDGAYFPVERDAPVNVLNISELAESLREATELRRLSSRMAGSSLRRRLVDSVDRLSVTLDGQTLIVELGLRIPSAISGQMTNFLRALIGGDSTQITTAATDLNDAITTLASTSPDAVANSDLRNLLLTIINSNGASGTNTVTDRVTNVPAGVLPTLLNTLGITAGTAVNNSVLWNYVRTSAITPPAAADDDGWNNGDTAGVVVGVLLGILLCCCLALAWRRRKQEAEKRKSKYAATPSSSAAPAVVTMDKASAPAPEFSHENPMNTSKSSFEPAPVTAPAAAAAAEPAAAPAPPKKGFKRTTAADLGLPGALSVS